MYYIIDANNLAGKLGILKADNLPRRLADVLSGYFDTRKKVYLVFDSNDTMGEVYEIDRLKIIYAPHDSYSATADDKIIELAERLNNETTEDVVVFTDDNGIHDDIREINLNASRKIGFRKCSDVVREIEVLKGINGGNGNKEEEDEAERLEADEIEEMNEELLKIWQNKKDA